MIHAKLGMCLVCLAGVAFAGSEPNGINAESVWRNTSEYTFMWWAHGLRDPSKVFHIQTSHYGLSFDFDDFELNTFGPLVNAGSQEEVLAQDNQLIEGLDRAALHCVIERGGSRYEATGAGPAWEDCMLVESGTYLQRRWLENITFAGGGGGDGPAGRSSLEICAWPDRIVFVLHVTPDAALGNGALEMTLDVGDVYARLRSEGAAFGLFDVSGRGFVFLTDDPEAALTCDAGQTRCTVRLETGDSWPAGSERSVGIVVYPVSERGPDVLEQVDRIEVAETPFPEKLKQILAIKQTLSARPGPEFMADLIPLNIDLGYALQRVMLFLIKGQQEGDIRADVRPEVLMAAYNLLNSMQHDPKIRSLYGDDEMLARDVFKLFHYGVLSAEHRESQLSESDRYMED